MQQQRVTQIHGVRERCVAEAGATASRWDCRVGCAALVAPASAHHVFRKYRSQIFHRSVLDKNRIDLASIADPYRNRDKCTTDSNFIDRRTP